MIINRTHCDYQSKLSNLSPTLYCSAVAWILSFSLNEQFDRDKHLDASTVQSRISIYSGKQQNTAIYNAIFIQTTYKNT